jgi:hypothetical protein
MFLLASAAEYLFGAMTVHRVGFGSVSACADGLPGDDAAAHSQHDKRTGPIVSRHRLPTLFRYQRDGGRYCRGSWGRVTPWTPANKMQQSAGRECRHAVSQRSPLDPDH